MIEPNFSVHILSIEKNDKYLSKKHFLMSPLSGQVHVCIRDGTH